MPKHSKAKHNVARAQRRKSTRHPRNQRHGIRDSIIPSHSLLGGFGASMQSADRSMLYQSTGGTGSVTTKHELGLSVVDFFDYQSAKTSGGGFAQYVLSYFWDVNQNLFDTFSGQTGGGDSTFCRVRKLQVWVMPQSRGQIYNTGSPTGEEARTNAEQMFTVNAQVPGTVQNRDSLEPNVAFALDTQVTNCLPTINPKWKSVLKCDLQKTFQSAVAVPYYAKGGLTPASYSNQVLFSLSVVDPRNGKPYQTGNTDDPDPSLRFKVKLWVDQPINTLNSAKFATYQNEDFALPATGQNGPNFYDTSSSYAQMDLIRAQDYLR